VQWYYGYWFGAAPTAVALVGVAATLAVLSLRRRQGVRPERVLDVRLANGEIDVAEHERLRAALGGAGGWSA
jgi:hypothetical protein